MRKFGLRHSIILGSTLLAMVLVITDYTQYSLSSLRIIRLSQWSALLSLLYLYHALIISPLWSLWPSLPGKQKAIRARRAIGVVGWGFGLLHGTVAFFGQLSGFAGLGFLSDTYIVALLYGTVALFLFTLMTLTSSDWAVSYFGFLQWKLLHRFTYIASFLVVIHTLMLGTHFNELSNRIPSIFSFFFILLIVLELYRLWIYVWHMRDTSLGHRLSVSLIAIFFALFGALAVQSETNGLTVHPAHTGSHDASHSIASNAFTLRFTTQKTLQAGVPVTANITILDKASQVPIRAMIPTHERLLHLVIVDEHLEWFVHQDPSYADFGFTTTLTLPHAGKYYVYATFQELGKIETTLSTTITVNGDPQSSPPLAPLPDYEVIMLPTLKMPASDLSSGKVPLLFSVLDKRTHIPIARIDPYLGTLGHLVLIRRGSYEYYHIHPTIDQALYAAQNPLTRRIPFAPVPSHGPIPPGMYRVFAEFSVQGKVSTYSFYLTLE